MLYCIGTGKKLTKETCLRFLLPVLCVCVFCFCLFAFFPFFYIERGAQHFLTNNKIHGLSSIKSKTNLYFKTFFIYISKELEPQVTQYPIFTKDLFSLLQGKVQHVFHAPDIACSTCCTEWS